MFVLCAADSDFGGVAVLAWLGDLKKIIEGWFLLETILEGDQLAIYLKH
jgi:hypothetical protein